MAIETIQTDYTTYREGNLTYQENQSAKELGIIAVAAGSQDIVSNDMTYGTPSQDVDDVESNRIVRLQEAHVLFSSRVPGLEVGQPVLLG